MSTSLYWKSPFRFLRHMRSRYAAIERVDMMLSRAVEQLLLKRSQIFESSEGSLFAAMTIVEAKPCASILACCHAEAFLAI